MKFKVPSDNERENRSAGQCGQARFWQQLPILELYSEPKVIFVASRGLKLSMVTSYDEFIVSKSKKLPKKFGHLASFSGSFS